MPEGQRTKGKKGSLSDRAVVHLALANVLLSSGQGTQDLSGHGQHNIGQERQGQNGQQPGHAGSAGHSLPGKGAALAGLAQEYSEQGYGSPQGEGMKPIAQSAQFFT